MNKFVLGREIVNNKTVDSKKPFRLPSPEGTIICAIRDERIIELAGISDAKVRIPFVCEYVS